MELEKFIHGKKNDINNIAIENGVKNIRIFGSVARKEENIDSDIDFLVTFEDGRSLFDLISLKNDLEDLLDRKVDVVTEESVHWSIKDKIENEAIEI